MKTQKFATEDEWYAGRKGKITGSKAKGLIPTGGPTVEMVKNELQELGSEIEKGAKKEDLENLLPEKSVTKLLLMLDKKMEFWQLLADRLSTDPDEEYPMDRGKRLEAEAIDRFRKETGKKVDSSLIILTRDDDESISVSPDGIIGQKEAVEAKCLKSALHLKAFFTQEIPDEYYYQVLQYFLVNDYLETLHFVFYDPRVLVKDYFVIEVKRKGIEAEIKKYLAYEKGALEEINAMVNKLTFDDF